MKLHYILNHLLTSFFGDFWYSLSWLNILWMILKYRRCQYADLLLVVLWLTALAVYNQVLWLFPILLKNRTLLLSPKNLLVNLPVYTACSMFKFFPIKTLVMKYMYVPITVSNIWWVANPRNWRKNRFLLGRIFFRKGVFSAVLEL